jgi:hypothetical protein
MRYWMPHMLMGTADVLAAQLAFPRRTRTGTVLAR